MKYFHLTPDKQTRGPYSADELRALRASGAIDDDTLAAAAGETSWRPYRELNLGEEGNGAVPPPVVPRTLGNCPFCGQEIVGTETPAECPHCGKTLHPGTGNLWLNFLSCMRRYVCFRGRATRTEYWSFYLFFYLISYVAQMLIEFSMTLFFDYPLDIREQLDAAESLTGIIAVLQPHAATILGGILAEQAFALLFLLPFYSVVVRRLHDTGRSAAALVWNLIAWGLFDSAIVFFGYTLYLGWQNDPSFAEMVWNAEGMMLSMGAMLIGAILILSSGLYLFICSLLPTKKGPNKYGPSL